MSGITAETASTIETLYREGVSSKVIAERVNLNPRTIVSVLTRRGVPRRPKGAGTKYTLDEDYFATVNTLEKLWVLGWFYSDGYNNEETADVRIGLNDCDVAVLRQIGSLMGSNRPLHMVPMRHVAILTVGRRKLSDDLAKLGCGQRKSLIVEWPSHLLDTRAKECAFLRGVLEGDGCICISGSRGKRYVGVTISCASPRFVDSLATVFLSNWGLRGCIMKSKDRSVVGIRFTGPRSQLKVMLMEIYDLTILPYHLERKYLKSLEAITVIDASEAAKTSNRGLNRKSCLSPVYRGVVPIIAPMTPIPQLS